MCFEGRGGGFDDFHRLRRSSTHSCLLCWWVIVDQAARCPGSPKRKKSASRSEEHTSELQSLMRISYAVSCLNKKKTDMCCRSLSAAQLLYSNTIIAIAGSSSLARLTVHKGR